MEEEEQNDEGSCESIESLASVRPIHHLPEDKTEESQEERQKYVSQEVNEDFADHQIVAQKAVEGDDAGRHISERLGSLIDLADLTRPIQIEVESDDDELKMVGQYFEID